MFVSTFLLGLAPIKINFSKLVIRYVSLMGAGLLVGASLIIIIPEGILVLIASLAKNPKLVLEERDKKAISGINFEKLGETDFVDSDLV
jgi:hypothetical protein